MPSTLHLDHGTLDLVKGSFHPTSGPSVSLTTRELALCRWLATRPGEPISRDELMQEVLRYAPGVDSRAIDYTVFRLRAKIEATPAAPRVVLTCYGKGYKLVVPDQPTIEERWLGLVGGMSEVHTALKAALQVLPEATVVDALRHHGIIALSPAAQACIQTTLDALDSDTRSLLVRLLPWRQLSNPVLQEQGAGLHQLARLLKSGFLLRQGDTLVVPECLRTTLMELVDRERLDAATAEHALWVERCLAVGWHITPRTLLYACPTPPVAHSLYLECREAMVHRGPLGRRTLRVLTAQRFASSKEILETVRELQQQVEGVDRWDLRAREASCLATWGQPQQARSIWRALADCATARGWPHRALSATVQSLLGTPDLDESRMASLQATADQLGVHSVSCMLRVMRANCAPKDRSANALAEGTRFARVVRRPYFEIMSLINRISEVRFGRTQQTIPHLERAIALSQSAQFPHLEAQARNNLAVCLADLGQYERAVAVSRDAIRLADDANAFTRSITSRATLAAALHSMGRLEEAHHAYLEASSQVAGPSHSLLFALQATVEADMGEVVCAEATLTRATAPACLPFVQLAELHIALARHRSVDRIRSELGRLPADALLGTWLHVDYSLARERLSLAIARTLGNQGHDRTAPKRCGPPGGVQPIGLGTVVSGCW